jgi:6-phosphogluconolactonase
MAGIANCKQRPMSRQEIRVFPDTRTLYEDLTHHIRRAVADTPGEFHLALSGGSTPLGWFDSLISENGGAIEWQKVRLFWADERCVPPDHPDSNYGAALQRLIRPLGIGSDRVFRIKGELVPERALAEYERELRSVLPGGPPFPVFDLILLGMGADGHTASIFPGQEHLWKAMSSCVRSAHPGTGQPRISLSGGTINAAREVVFLVTGREKSAALARVLPGSGAPGALPASWVGPASGRLLWYLDGAAAGKPVKA